MGVDDTVRRIQLEFFKVAAVTDPVKNRKHRRLVQGGQDPMPDASVIVHSLPPVCQPRSWTYWLARPSSATMTRNGASDMGRKAWLPRG